MNGNRMPTQINGSIYSWSQLTITIAGFIESGITKIDYSDKQTIEKIYGIGQTPIGRGYGNIETTGSITLTRRAVESMREAVPITRRLQDIPPFDVVVCFVPHDGGKIVTHRLIGCVFEEDSLSAAQGETKDEVSIALNILRIER